MTEIQLTPNRRSWTIVVGILLASFLVYAVVAYVVSLRPLPDHAPSQDFFRYVLFVFGTAVLVFAAVTSPKADPSLTPEVFFGKSFRSLLIASSGAIYGLVLAFARRSFLDYVLLGGASTVVIIVFVVRPGLAYWRLRESVSSPAARL